MIQEFAGKDRLQLLGYRVLIETHRVFAELEQPTLLDEYMLSRLPDGIYGAVNLRTDHHHKIPESAMLAFIPDPANSPSGLQRGRLTVGHELWQSYTCTWQRPRNC